MSVIVNSLPGKVFSQKWNFEIYNYDLVFHSYEGIDIFFDSLDYFLKRKNQTKYFIRSLHPLSGEYNGSYFDEIIHIGELNDFTFASWLDEFYFVDSEEDWTIYCNRSIELIFFGFQPNIQTSYHLFFQDLKMKDLKYKNINEAIKGVKPSLGLSSMAADFIIQLRKNYS
jgi:hypothetical protein